MTKTELITALGPMDDDAVVILKDDQGGWCNIKDVVTDGSCIAITNDYDRPFSSE